MPRRNPKNPKIIRFTENINKSCKNKKRFETETLAKREVELQSLLYPENNYDFYKCNYCLGFHLTTKK